jgi:hypothetical protein
MRTFSLDVSKEEGHVLIAAAIRGLRGKNPMEADKFTENCLIDKLINFGGGLPK